MKIYPIISLKTIQTQNDVKRKEAISQEKQIESNSLEILGNYNLGGLSFGKSVREIKHDTRKLLQENGRFDKQSINFLVSCIGNRQEIASIQFNLIKAVIENEGFKISDINSIVSKTKYNVESAEIQSNLFLNLLNNHKFQPNALKDIFCSINSSIETAKIQSEIAVILSQNDRMSDFDIANIVKNIEIRESNAEKELEFKKSFVFEVMDDERFSPSVITDTLKNMGKTVYPNRRNKIEDEINNQKNKCDTKSQYDFIKMVLGDKLADNKHVISSLPSIIGEITNKKDAETTFKLLKNLNEEGFLNNKLFDKDSQAVYFITEYIKKRPEADIKKILTYTEKIDFNRLSKKAPLMETFDFDQYMTFADYHLRMDSKTEFDDKDLIFDKDLSEFLSDNYLDRDSLTDLFSAFPLTKRSVGAVPFDWLSKIPDDKKEETIEKIYDAISEFQKKRPWKYYSKNPSREDELSIRLSEILKKETDVKELGLGAFGIGYKIEVEGAKPVCLKTFHDRRISVKYVLNEHGVHAEVQAGLFANKHSSDFVKMYFGRVSPRNTQDGFLVTQFLDKKTEPDNSVGEQKDRYDITSNDKRQSNIINGKIIDYGAIQVRDRSGKIIEPYSII